MEDSVVYAILPAAGNGERMKTVIPKQYLSVLHEPLICHAVDAFLNVPWILKIIVVSSTPLDVMQKALLTKLKSCKFQERIVIIEGASTRHKSIFLGLESIRASGVIPDIVVIHDGVRPIVPLEILTEVVTAAKEFGAAGVIQPLVSTVVSRDQDGLLNSSLDRNKYWASEMPQAFQFSLIQEAYSKCTDHDLDYGTECLHLVHKYTTGKAKLVESTVHLWKVTHRKDLYAAEGTLKELRSVVICDTGANTLLVKTLNDSLQRKFSSVLISGKDEVAETTNLVKIHTNKTVSEIICDELNVHSSAFQIQPRAMVHVCGSSEELYDRNVHKKAREFANSLKKHGIYIYFISCTLNEPMSEDSCRNLSDIVTSLLFDCNVQLSGFIVYF